MCENCSYLRVGTGNVELAGLFAPKPLAMSAAKDWTIDLETKGLPELKKLYKLFDAEANVDGKCWPEFGHNYNQPAREMMYRWFAKHLLGKDEEVKEKSFVPIPPKDLSVYDAEHPRTKDELDAAGLRKVMAEMSDKQMAALEPKDAKSLAESRRVVGTALRVMAGGPLPEAGGVERRFEAKELASADGVVLQKALIGRTGGTDAVPAVGMTSGKFDKATVVVWVHPNGKASLLEKEKPVPAARAMLDAGAGILAIDAFGTGEHVGPKEFPVNDKYAGFTFGYNPSTLAKRVQDVLTAVAFARDVLKAKTVHVVGWESAGPWAVLAKALAGDAVARTAFDTDGFRFEKIASTGDPMMLPGAVKYGGLGAFESLCAPGELYSFNHAGTATGHAVKAAYTAAGAADKLKRDKNKVEPVDVAKWLLR